LCATDDRKKDKVMKHSIDKENILGLQKYNCKGDLMKIISFINYKNIIVEFQDEFKYQVKTTFTLFQKGEITNKFGRHICGIGYLGNTSSSNNGKTKKSYYIWSSIIKRCYDDKVINRHSSYNGCIICKEWECYENFEKWYNIHYYNCPIGGKMCVDKDILFKGNKVYSPETCCIVPNEINCLLTKSDKIRGNLPIGINLWKNKLHVQMSKIIDNKKVKVHLGYFNKNEIDLAFNKYKQEKERYIKEEANKFKAYIPNNVYNALINYKIEITD
jgi:hypothetical protein